MSRLKFGDATCNNSHDILVEILESLKELDRLRVWDGPGWSRGYQITTAKHEGNYSITTLWGCLLLLMVLIAILMVTCDGRSLVRDPQLKLHQVARSYATAFVARFSVENDCLL